MPTKFNRWGKQQNYDPSNGQYGEGDGAVELDKTKGRKKIKEQVSTKYKWIVPRDELDQYYADALKYIITETTMSEEKAKEFQNAIIEWTNGDYKAFSKGEQKDKEKIIDEGLKKMPYYDNIIYRGMRFKADQKNEFEKISSCPVGDTIQMRSVSGWTSKEPMALHYAFADDIEKDSVILFCENNKNGVGIQNISKWGASEAEVLCPSTSKWRVLKNEVVTKYDYLSDYYNSILQAHDATPSEKSLVPSLLGTLDHYEKDYKRVMVCKLYVEEI